MLTNWATFCSSLFHFGLARTPKWKLSISIKSSFLIGPLIHGLLKKSSPLSITCVMIHKCYRAATVTDPCLVSHFLIESTAVVTLIPIRASSS